MNKASFLKMKFILVILVIILNVNKGVFAQSFYDLNTVQTISITFSQSNWDYILDTAKAGSETYLMAQSVVINGVQYDSVGIKYKGNSTYNANQNKNPFHIELDAFKEQDYQGYTDIKLSNVAKDPSFVREVLSYSILRKYMAAPQSNYVNVTVNGALIGLYVSSESIGKKFVNKYFYSKDNSFFKCNPINGAGPTTTTLPRLVYLGTDSANYNEAYEIKSTSGWNDLIALINTLNNNIVNIENVLDVDRTLWMLAFNNVTVNLDSYIGTFAQNYYLYKDGTGRFNPVMWDFNEGFGTFSQTGTVSLANTTAKKQMTHLLHYSDANWPLVKQLLAVAQYKKMYLAHYQTILNENFSNGSYLTTAQGYQAIINASVQADANKFFTYTQYQSNLTTDVTATGGGPGGSSTFPGISNLMSGRNTYISTLTDFTNTKPIITNIKSSDTTPVINSNIYITATITNTNAVFLGYRYDVGNKFIKISMFDDGNHGDGAAGDNVYGASLTVSSGFVQYYIYAENANVGAFSPARAEYEFYSITAKKIVGDILMNEIYARGTTASPDWIELYNTSAAAIDISGYKIYDAGGYGGTKPKKEFPTGTIINPSSFVVITVDDTAASGFGLSSSGEKVWLEDAIGTVIDTVTYLTHTATQSYGRIPNGSATWQVLNTITKNASNVSNLPVTLFTFIAKKESNNAILNWTTLNEINNNYFEIEKSNNSKDFFAIGTVKSKGNSTTSANYLFIDEKPLNGNNYYRLKQVDINGKYSFSNIILLKNNSEMIVAKVYPNPATNYISIDLQEKFQEDYLITISTIEGKVVYKKSYNKNTTNCKISTAQFTNDNYILSIKNKSINTNFKILINK